MGPDRPRTLRLGFQRRGVAVEVDAEIRVNDDAEHYGCHPCALGFPVCRATISPPPRGYDDALGWIQFVRQPDWGGEFQLDPFEPFGAPNSPFCFFGFAPTLFDAPHRDTFPDMECVAHSFVAGIRGIHQPREALAGTGFRWAYRIRDSRIEVDPPEPLGPADWDEHLPYLRGTFPGWEFVPGFALEDGAG